MDEWMDRSMDGRWIDRSIFDTLIFPMIDLFPLFSSALVLFRVSIWISNSRRSVSYFFLSRETSALYLVSISMIALCNSSIALWLLFLYIQYNHVQCNTIQYNTMDGIANTIQCNTNIMQCNTKQFKTLQYNANLSNTDLMLSISSSFSLSRLSSSALSWAMVALAESRRLWASLRASVTSASSAARASFSVSSWMRFACSSWSRWFNSLICPRASLRASKIRQPVIIIPLSVTHLVSFRGHRSYVA